MSICSDVFISREEARKRVESILIDNQKELVKLAVQNMEDFDLTHYLNKDGDLYYYNIENEE